MICCNRLRDLFVYLNVRFPEGRKVGILDPVIRNFASHLGLALMVHAPSQAQEF